jgi:predicted DNA-binding transcriptional regulator AlpA
MTGLTVADLDSLPPAIDLATAARVLGIGRTTAYELARRGTFPCRVLRIGGLYRVATPDLIRLLTATSPGTPEAAGQ